MSIKQKKQNALKYLEKINHGPLTFSQLLLALRQTENLSQKDFAIKLDIPKQYLCDIEKGRRQVSIEKAALFAKKLGYPQALFVNIVLKDQIRTAGLKLKIKVSA